MYGTNQLLIKVVREKKANLLSLKAFRLYGAYITAPFEYLETPFEVQSLLPPMKYWIRPLKVSFTLYYHY